MDGEAWKWRRMLFAWEDECVVQLSLVVLQVAREDIWAWSLHASNYYTVLFFFFFFYRGGT